MPKGSLNMSLKGADDIFSTEESRQEQQREQVQQIPIGELHPFTNHPFKVVDDEAMTRTVESIAQFGVLAPLIARPRPDGDGYEIISGHRRQFAAKMAGLETLPVIVRNMDDDAATILMVDSNLQREHISPSERAFAYKMKMDAMKRTAGRPSKENSRQVVGNFETADLIGKESGESGRQVQRFIRLTNLIPELCELVVGGKEGLQPVEKTVIDRCVHVVYRKYFENPTPENMPLLEDLYNALLTQDEPEARHVAAALEIYVKGSLNIFNHHTNVDIHNRIVCFDIKQLGKQLKKLGMLIVQDAVWGRVTANRSAGKSTRYYADEFHLLLKEEQTAAYSVEIWKRFRKWGGIPTALTQNVKDLLASPEVSNIFENSDFVYMLNQANGDRQILAKQLNISPHQLSYVTHSGEGEGLLFFGNVILPFVDHFPKDLELYRILTTKLNEISEGAQK